MAQTSVTLACRNYDGTNASVFILIRLRAEKSHEKNDVRPHVARLGCPHLALAGAGEHPFFPQYAKELADATGAEGRCRIIDGSDHFYNDHQGDAIDAIAGWLQQFHR